jgi:LCP family protein required for cell wall assembly
VSSTPGATLDRPSASGDEPDDGNPAVPVPPVTEKKRRDPLWAKLVIGFGVLLLVASGGLVSALKYGAHKVNSSVTTVDVDAINKDANGNEKHATIPGAKNILLVGIDPRDEDYSSGDGIRADSIIILHVNSAHDAAYLVSIPRDTKVAIPAKTGAGTKHGAGNNKINTSFAWGADGLTGNAALAGGLDLLAKTIRQDYQIEFDAAAIVNFDGFQQVVNYIGGVDLYVDEDTTSIHIGHDAQGNTVVPYRQSADLMHVYPIKGVTPMKYTKGWHHFAGWEALDYVRQRHILANGDGDYGRQRHQQQFIKAVFKKIATQYMSSTKLPGLIEKVGQTMTVSDGGISLTDWVFAMKGIGQDGLVTMKTNGGQFDSIEGTGYEQLSDESLDMLKAVREDTMGQWAVDHQNWVADS